MSLFSRKPQDPSPPQIEDHKESPTLCNLVLNQSPAVLDVSEPFTIDTSHVGDLLLKNGWSVVDDFERYSSAIKEKDWFTTADINLKYRWAPTWRDIEMTGSKKHADADLVVGAYAALTGGTGVLNLQRGSEPICMIPQAMRNFILSMRDENLHDFAGLSKMYQLELHAPSESFSDVQTMVQNLDELKRILKMEGKRLLGRPGRGLGDAHDQIMERARYLIKAEELAPAIEGKLYCKWPAQNEPYMVPQPVASILEIAPVSDLTKNHSSSLALRDHKAYVWLGDLDNGSLLPYLSKVKENVFKTYSWDSISAKFNYRMHQVGFRFPAGVDLDTLSARMKSCHDDETYSIPATLYALSHVPIKEKK